MNEVGRINTGTLTTAPPGNRVQLKRLADEMESVFLNQLVFLELRISLKENLVNYLVGSVRGLRWVGHWYADPDYFCWMNL